MPITLNPNSGTSGMDPGVLLNLEEYNYSYSYPHRLSLKPGSEQHRMLRDKIMERAHSAHITISSRFGRWKEMDKVLKAYVRPGDRFFSKRDSRHSLEGEKAQPKIVIPASYALMKTSQAYYAAAFLQKPIFRYEGVGPEDVLGAMLMQLVIDLQCHRYRAALPLLTAFRDDFAYGMGIVTPMWHVQMGTKTVLQEEGFINTFSEFISTGFGRVVEDYHPLFEGNRLMNINPYRFLPDPNVPVHQVQDGEFVGWVERSNRMKIMRAESTGDDFIFNGKYLKHIDGQSSIATDGGIGSALAGPVISNRNVHNVVDIVWMYVDLIPKEWKLGKSEYPEKWVFALAGDEVIIAAHPSNLDHGLFPVAVSASNTDGYSSAPTGKMEIFHDVQNLVDFLHTSHMVNVMKAINDMFVVDPSLINIHDLADPKPGKQIRMRKRAWGRGGLKEAIMQLQVNDVTQANIGDASNLIQMLMNFSGATDTLMGMVGRQGPRVSSAEIRGARSSGLNKFELDAQYMALQMLRPLGYMMASQTQQLMSQDVFVKIGKEAERRLRDEFGINTSQSRLGVSPLDLVVEYDLMEFDGRIPGAESVEDWIQLYQIMAQNPIVMQGLDHMRIFNHIARQMGVKSPEDFIQRTQVIPDEQIEPQISAGNLTPLGGDGLQ